jgi:hypothetical protein
MMELKMLVNVASRRDCGANLMRPIVAISLAALAILPAPAFAKTEPGKVYGAISGGTEFPVGGNVHDGAVAPVANLGPLNPALAGVAAELRVEKRSQQNIYKNPYNLALELGYGVSESGEVFGSVRRLISRTGRAQVGNAVVTTTVAGAPPVGTVLPINGTFGRYKSVDVELGYRQYFGAGTVQPYGAVRGGVGFVDRINASFAIPAAAININNARFYKPSAVFAGGVDLGLSFDVGANASLQAETGLRYASKLRGEDADIAGLGLAAINNSGDRFAIPVTVRLKVGF